MSRYQEAGVDIHAGYELVNKIKKMSNLLKEWEQQEILVALVELLT